MINDAQEGFLALEAVFKEGRRKVQALKKRWRTSQSFR